MQRKEKNNQFFSRSSLCLCASVVQILFGSGLAVDSGSAWEEQILDFYGRENQLEPTLD